MIDGILYVKGNKAKHGEITKAEFDIFNSEKHNGWTTSTTNANPVVNDIQTKISSLTERDNIFSETER